MSCWRQAKIRDCLQEETPSAGDERSARLQAVHFISLKNEMKNPWTKFVCCYRAAAGKRRRWEHEVFAIAERRRQAPRTISKKLCKCVKNALKKHTRSGVFFSGAADQTWTGDLILTKDVLYLLSHSSVFVNAQLLYWIRRNMSNEMSNKTKSRKNNLLRCL